MVEIIGKFLDSLYETSKSCDDFSVYEFQKEWYENNGYIVIFENEHHKVLHEENNQFDVEQEGRLNMTVRDLYVNTDENQEFIMWFESEPSKACYKGKLENCPSELMYMLVDKFRAIDFNTIEVILIGQ